MSLEQAILTVAGAITNLAHAITRGQAEEVKVDSKDHRNAVRSKRNMDKGAVRDATDEGTVSSPSDAPTATPETTTTNIYDQCAEALTALSREQGRDVAVAVLKQFDANKLPVVATARLPELLAAVQVAREKR